MSAQDSPSDERLFTDEQFGAELFWAKNKTRILLAAAAVLIALGATAWVIVSRHNADKAARHALALASNVDEWKDVMERHRGTASAEAAAILVAGSLREAGDISGSTQAYEAFLADHANSPLAPLAKLGEAQNAAAAGQQDKALQLLKNLSSGSDPMAAPLAGLLEARELIGKGAFEQARSALEAISTQFPDSLPARVVPSQLEQISLVAPAVSSAAPHSNSLSR